MFLLINNSNFDLANSINVIPNPTSGLLTFSTSIEIESLEIYNMLGELISTKPDLSNFSNGIYILKINTKNGTAIKKIIKE